MAGPAARLSAWLERRAPPVHRFLTRDDRPYPLVREVLAVALALVLLGAALWGFTGQRFGDAPVVVIESGSMMHCRNGVGHYFGDCQYERYGRLGTIDPGDLVFVRDVDGRGDVRTFGEDGERRYGLAGDVIVFQKNGRPGTPIIHRAMLWVQVNEDGSLTIPELDQTVAHPNQFQFDRAEYRAAVSCEISFPHGVVLGPEHSGFLTKGDNNNCFDQSSNADPALPVRPEWILGKSRGEVPWIGLIKLKVSDLMARTDNYGGAPGDVKTMLWVSVGVLVVAPFALEVAARALKERKQRGGKDADDGDDRGDAGSGAGAPPSAEEGTRPPT